MCVVSCRTVAFPPNKTSIACNYITPTTNSRCPCAIRTCVQRCPFGRNNLDGKPWRPHDGVGSRRKCRPIIIVVVDDGAQLLAFLHLCTQEFRTVMRCCVVLCAACFAVDQVFQLFRTSWALCWRRSAMPGNNKQLALHVVVRNRQHKTCYAVVCVCVLRGSRYTVLLVADLINGLHMLCLVNSYILLSMLWIGFAQLIAVEIVFVDKEVKCSKLLHRHMGSNAEPKDMQKWHQIIIIWARFSTLFDPITNMGPFLLFYYVFFS